MAEITFPYAPGFADVPDSSLAAEQYAQGVLMGRIVENASMGMVRPEVFVTTQKHGDTVPLPVSSVDNYQYSRDELIYMWGVTSTANPTTGSPSDPKKLIWFAQWFVNQDTGAVTSEIWYSNDSGKQTLKSNDGTLTVYTIGSRRKNSMSLSEIPYYVEHPDSDYATDKALHETALQDANRNAKFSIVNSEAIYMGTFKSTQKVALPVSPVDGYQYSQDEVIWLWSWVWTTDGDSYEAPIVTVPLFGNLLTQLHRIRAHVDADGTVHTNVVYYYDHEIDMGDQMGRIAVTALCSRSGKANANLDVNGRCVPWRDTGGINSAYPVPGLATGNDPVRVAVTPGSTIRVKYISGKTTVGGAHGFWDTVGHPGETSVPGSYVSGGCNGNCLIMSFVDATGQLVAAPIAPGLDWTGVVPAGTTYAQFGNNDDTSFGDNSGDWIINVSGIPTTGGPSGVAGSIGNCNEFSWFDSSLLGPGEPDRTDLMVQTVKNIREAVARPEFFDAGDFTDGSTVPLPSSPIDAYTYTRDELVYLYELGDTGPILGGDIRLVGWSFSIGATTGLVSISELHKKDGGRNVTDHQGTLRVKIIAIRSASHAIPTPSTISDSGTGNGSNTNGSSGNVDNGGLDDFSGSGQTIADGWQEVDDATGTRSYAQETGLSPIGSAQGITVNSGAGNLGGVRNARSEVCTGDRWVMTFRAAASVSITSGFIARLRFWNSDATDSVTANVVSGALGTSTVNKLIGVKIPASGDTNLWTAKGSVALSAAPGWTPAWVDLEFVVSAPSATTTVSVDDVDWIPAVRNIVGFEVDTSTDPTDGQALLFDATGKVLKFGIPSASMPSGAANLVLATPDGSSGAASLRQLLETDLAGFTDVTTANASTSKHGLLPKLPNDSSKFLNGVGAWTTPSGGGGSGNAYGPFSSRPAANSVSAGYVYRIQGTPLKYVSDGTNWIGFFQDVPIDLAEPPTSGFSWVNQGSAAVDTSQGGLIVKCPNDTANSFKCYVKTAPATPYTWTVRFVAGLPTSDFSNCGIVLRQSSTGKLYVFGAQWATNQLVVYGDKYTNPTTQAGGLSVAATVLYNGQIITASPIVVTLEITDPGGTGNLVFRVYFGSSLSPTLPSMGVRQFATDARQTFMTSGGPDQIGYFINPRNTGSFPAYIWVVGSNQ